MPLIVMVGMPGSGKTKRAQQIAEYFEKEKSKEVHIVSENDVIKNKNLDKNIYFTDSHKEKEIRGILKSSALRQLRKDNIVILDACNYIKGFRYELYCASKNSKSTQVTVECVVRLEKALEWNSLRPDFERYTKETFDGLIIRYEAPDSRNRWDSPLMLLQSDDTINFEELHSFLFGRKPPPPNLSTQTVPLAQSNCLYDLDRVTQEIVNEILGLKKLGLDGSGVELCGIKGCILEHVPEGVTPAQLARHRRQFINYTKIHPPSESGPNNASTNNLAQQFVQFLNTTFSPS
ncbi:hypothetical protein AAG570_013513 [Ranatra chinensis]|uniref:Protein KTI12 homolog n=1 Tax=Ranatra chinensis TaxID=642074 RepID=A0ABD0YD29_9HEMI